MSSCNQIYTKHFEPFKAD